MVVVLVLAAFAGDVCAQPAGTARIKDVASLQGYPSVPLLGYGLVVGLAKTGDRRQTIFSAQTLANMLETLRRHRLPRREHQGREHRRGAGDRRNCRRSRGRGARIDVTRVVGRRRAEPAGRHAARDRRCADPTARVTRVAQGPLTIGGFGGGERRQRRQVNHLTAGTRARRRTRAGSADGWRCRRRAISSLTLGRARLRQRVAVGDQPSTPSWGPASAHAVDAGDGRREGADRVHKAPCTDLMARLEPLPVSVDTAARVVINERTGTVVVGSNVRHRGRRRRPREPVGEDQHAVRGVAAVAVLEPWRDGRGAAAGRQRDRRRTQSSWHSRKAPRWTRWCGR